MYSWDLIEAWAEAEENLGLNNSMFFMDNGTVTQWVDADESDKFYESVKLMDFAKVFEEFFEALEIEDKVKIFEGLAVFHEIDEHPKIASDEVLRRLKRVREKTHNKIYEI